MKRIWNYRDYWSWNNLQSVGHNIRAELKLLNKEIILETSLNEVGRISIHALLPALICTLNKTMGIDTVFAMWLMVIVVAYIIHSKQMKVEQNQGIFSGISWVRFAALSGMILIASWANPSIENNIFLKGSNIITKFLFQLLAFQIKAIENIALYRMYLSIFGVVAVTVRNKMSGEKKPGESTKSTKSD